jgi:hypothetical protein
MWGTQESHPVGDDTADKDGAACKELGWFCGFFLNCAFSAVLAILLPPRFQKKRGGFSLFGAFGTILIAFLLAGRFWDQPAHLS